MKAKVSHPPIELVAKRLLNAEAVDAEEALEAGKEAGRVWVESDARPKQLRRLQRDWHERRGTPYDSPDNLARVIQPRYEEEYDTLKDFWEQVLGEEGLALISDDDFAQGFIEGALQVWEEVADTL